MIKWSIAIGIRHDALRFRGRNIEPDRDTSDLSRVAADPSPSIVYTNMQQFGKKPDVQIITPSAFVVHTQGCIPIGNFYGFNTVQLLSEEAQEAQ